MKYVSAIEYIGSSTFLEQQGLISRLWYRMSVQNMNGKEITVWRFSTQAKLCVSRLQKICLKVKLKAKFI